MRLAVVHYAVAVLVVANVIVVLNWEPLFYGTEPHFPSTCYGNHERRNHRHSQFTPVHDRSKVKTMRTRLSHSCHLTRKLKLELVL